MIDVAGVDQQQSQFFVAGRRRFGFQRFGLFLGEFAGFLQNRSQVTIFQADLRVNELAVAEGHLRVLTRPLNDQGAGLFGEVN